MVLAVAGGEIEAAHINALEDASLGKPLVRLVQSVAQNVNHNTVTAITFTTEDIDTHGFHDNGTNPSRVTPNVAGYYRVDVTVWWAAPTALISTYAGVGKNGAATTPLNRVKPVASSTTCSVTTTAIVACNGTTDYVEALAQHLTTGSVALSTSVGGGTGSVLEVEYLRAL